VIFYAVVSDEIEQVIEFFRTPAEAEAMLETVLEDEPGWREILYVEPVEFVTGGRTSQSSYGSWSLGCSAEAEEQFRGDERSRRIA
jgi:hypothetical protein